MARPPVIKAPDQIVTLGDKIRCALYLVIPAVIARGYLGHGRP